jgi:hypothetical protein
MAPFSYSTLAALLLLSASSSSAFVHVGVNNGNPTAMERAFNADGRNSRLTYLFAKKSKTSRSSGVGFAKPKAYNNAVAEATPSVSFESPVDVTKQEAFHRAMLVAQLANKPKQSAVKPSASPANPGDVKKQEAFHRAMLVAQFANKPEQSIVAAVVEGEGAEPEAVDVDVSVDYDAAARLAYEAVGKDGKFDAFKEKYLADTSAMIAQKHKDSVANESKVAADEPNQRTPIIGVSETEPAVAESTPLVEEPTPVLSPAPEDRAPLPRTEFTVPREFSIVPINEATVQFTAGILGATAGLLLGGGPLLAGLLAATTNYLSRKDDSAKGEAANATSAKKVVDTASQTALLMYNFIANFEKQNKVVDTTLRVLEGAVDKAKESDTPAGSTIGAIESTLSDVSKKVEELNDDYDLVGGVRTILSSVGDLVEVSVDKVVQLNDEYKLTDRVGGVVKGTVNKMTEKKD